jgi:protoheme IX farnesyltransferase
MLPILLPAIIFLWTPPYFWRRRCSAHDYANAGVPMLPVVAGIESTRRQILFYTLPMIAAAIAPWVLGLTSWIYGAASIVLNAIFLALAFGVFANKASEPKAMGPEKRLFAFSIIYLFGLFAALVVDRWIF